jgi:hypothetical protein
MTDRIADVEAALERVVVAARAHLAAVRAADGEPDDDAVWDAYVGLNNASHEYDDLLNDVFGEVTPWDLEPISAEHPHGTGRFGTVVSGVDDGPAGLDDDPYPRVVSIRQRRDYRIPSVAALFRLAEEGRLPLPEGEPVEPITTVADALLELLQSGDGSLGMLDVRELEPLDGIVVVAEVRRALNEDGQDEAEGDPNAVAPFQIGADDRTLGRLDERSLAGIDD